MWNKSFFIAKSAGQRAVEADMLPDQVCNGMITSHTEAWLDRYYFEKYVLEVSIATLERGGVTSRIDTYQFLDPIDVWAFPKYPGKTVILEPTMNIAEGIAEFIRENDACLREPDTWLGTWINPATQRCYLDITMISPYLDEATVQARIHSERENRAILALYNLGNHQTVYLGRESLSQE
ncbi:hypothetical protein [Ktedonospora formicarum]|uniref:Uncharacterized protein n=1 Tax=Ktedonospora formicarum TaxID=2778364 RepID=A0A8J3HR52_9CHLR|nr:hypothetical protein [Ktedonospora formicarum]GHO42317.1 hypothetical protein KSX_04800 [Ktedonospora formicarum]